MARTGRPKKYDFTNAVLGKSKLYKGDNLESLYRCARIYADSKGWYVSRNKTATGITLKFTEIYDVFQK